MFAEMGARRKRLRLAMGDRGQAVMEFLVLSGLVAGSLGLLIGDWMPVAAPWGFALPFVFVAGFLLIEARRQAALALFQRRLPEINADLDTQEWARLDAEMRADERSAIYQEDVKEKFAANVEPRRQYRVENAAQIIAPKYDWAALLWALGCALAGAAAFVIAWTAQPQALEPVEPGWTPPENAVSSDIVPVAP